MLVNCPMATFFETVLNLQNGGVQVQNELPSQDEGAEGSSLLSLLCDDLPQELAASVVWCSSPSAFTVSRGWVPHSALDLLSETGSVMGPHFFLSALPSGRSLLAFLISGKKGSFLKSTLF